MKRLALVLTLLSLLVLGGQTFAEDCTIDAVPAATLLVPYFAVDLSAPPGEGVDTLFSINNASAAPTIAHVSIWSDWSQPVLDFDIFLTGYDAQAVSLYQVFVNGNLPVTADEQSDQGQDGAGRIDDPTSSCSGDEDSCSPHGDNPEWDGSFDGSGIAVAGVSDCIDIFPFFVTPCSARLAGPRSRRSSRVSPSVTAATAPTMVTAPLAVTSPSTTPTLAA
jgi:hypothetical protein